MTTQHYVTIHYKNIYIVTYPHRLTTLAYIISAVASLQPQCQHSLKYKNEFGGAEQDTTSFTLLAQEEKYQMPQLQIIFVSL
jgi:hypothetical protein